MSVKSTLNIKNLTYFCEKKHLNKTQMWIKSQVTQFWTNIIFIDFLRRQQNEGPGE